MDTGHPLGLSQSIKGHNLKEDGFFLSQKPSTVNRGGPREPFPVGDRMLIGLTYKGLGQAVNKCSCPFIS